MNLGEELGFGVRMLESSWSHDHVGAELDHSGDDQKRRGSRRKTCGHNYAEGVGEIVGTKRADGEGVARVSRKTAALGRPRTAGREGFEKGTASQQRNPAAQ